MKIELLHDFAGRLTHEQRIYPGVYDEADERLFGLAQYLVDNDHAVVVTEKVSRTTSKDTYGSDAADLRVEPAELIPVNPPAKPAPAKPSRPSKAKARK